MMKVEGERCWSGSVMKAFFNFSFLVGEVSEWWQACEERRATV